MQGKKLCALCVLCGFFLSSFVFAQTEESANYYIDRNDPNERFIQRIPWQKADYALRYVVIIEQRQRNAYTEVERLAAEENFVEVALVVGHYRYRVEVYDLFDELSFVTAWREFEVIRALQPEVSSFSPEGFYLDEDDTWVITVRGRNLLPNSVYYLVRGSTRITPESFTADRNSARLVFLEEALNPGRYDIYVRNPGGLDVQYGTFTIGFRKPFDLNITLMYSPIVPVYGFVFKDSDYKAPFSDFIYPLSGGLRASLVPIKRNWGYMGAELSASFSYLESDHKHYTTTGYLLNTHVSFLYQRYFQKKTYAINASLGIGVSAFMNVNYEYTFSSTMTDTKSIMGASPSIAGSVSFSWFFIKSFYLNAGFDFIHILTLSDDGTMPGLIRPFVGVGMQL